MTVLVVGASGDVGSAAAAALVSRGVATRVLVRSTPVAVAGVEHVTGDLADAASLDRALDGVDAACFVTPHHVDEAALGHAFVDACERARLRRLVFVSAFHPLSRSRILQRLFDGVIGLVGPHYRAKLSVERRVRATAMSPIALCPSNFFQNDELVLPAITRGVYAQPLGSRHDDHWETSAHDRDACTRDRRYLRHWRCHLSPAGRRWLARCGGRSLTNACRCTGSRDRWRGHRRRCRRPR